MDKEFCFEGTIFFYEEGEPVMLRSCPGCSKCLTADAFLGPQTVGREFQAAQKRTRTLRPWQRKWWRPIALEPDLSIYAVVKTWAAKERITLELVFWYKHKAWWQQRLLYYRASKRRNP